MSRYFLLAASVAAAGHGARVRSGGSFWSKQAEAIEAKVGSQRSFDTTCVPDEEGWNACPYLVQTDIGGIINVTHWENWTAQMWLDGSKVLASDPNAERKAQRSLWQLNQLLRIGTNYGGNYITTTLKSYQDGLVDMVAETLANLTNSTAFDGFKEAVVETVNETQRGITAVFTAKTVLNREPLTRSPNICGSRWVQVKLPDGYYYTIDGWENAPIARVHHESTGCQEVWTVECQSQTLVKTAYCPFANTTVDFRCLANGFDPRCLFTFRAIAPPSSGSMLVRTPQSEGWTEVQPGQIEVRVVRPSVWSEADIHAGSAPFTGSTGPDDGMPSNIVTVTLPKFTSVLAENLCEDLPEPLRPACEFPWIQALRVVGYTSANFDVATRNSDLVIGYPVNLKAFEESGSESAAAYIGDRIPGYSAQNVDVSLSAEGSTINLSVILVLNGTVYVEG